MKNKKTTSLSTTLENSKKTTSLFDSILATESQAAVDASIHKYVARVGLVLKVLHNRNLTSLLMAFEDKLSSLVVTTCAEIDDELCSTEKNSKSEV